MVAHVFISGFVHGVGFRQFVKRKGRELGLTGWVKNLSDGRVEAKFCGDKKSIDTAIKELWKGTFLSDIKNIDVEWIGEKEKFLSFDVLTD